MKNSIKNIILAFSLLGFVTLTACGQTENTHNQEKTTKVEKVVKKEDLPKQNASTLPTTDAEYFENLGITTDQVALILEHNKLTIEQLKNKTEEETRDLWTKTKKQKTFTKPVLAATETSKVSVGEDPFANFDIAGDANIEIETGKKLDKMNNDKRNKNKEINIKIDNEKEIGKILDAKIKLLTEQKGVNKEEKKAPEQ